MSDQNIVNIIGTLVIIAIIASFVVWNRRQDKIRNEAIAKDQADMKAKAEAAWAIDYHNPASPNYDPARITAEQKAAADAWAQDPKNPNSPNYDPNAE